ncbi:MAG: hypothetical protein HXX11_00825 [Desulfuromonadales bacterium]|nr:hypothetical protein [Desulfuromonadales bacterium]
MKRILCAVLLTATLTTPALAAKLYLKDGGVIQAKRVWRSNGKVHVLATRDTLTSFEPYEVNLKRTFPKRHRVARKPVTAVRPSVTATTANQTSATAKPEEKKSRFSLPELPKLPEKSPESLVPSSGGGGVIRQHKKEMADRIGE